MGICQYQRPDKSDVGIFKKIAIRRQAPVEDCFQETGEKDMRYDFTKIIDRHGKDAKEWILKVGDELCLTPPMGWSSWYSYSGGVSQENILKTARLLITSGLAQYG